MNDSQNKLALLSNRMWAKIVAFYSVMVEYANDYLSGNKYNLTSEQVRNNQKQR